MPRRTTVIWVLLAFAACSAAAEDSNMYKWTDDQGQVHYSQFPPSGGKAEKMRAPPAPRPPANADEGDRQESPGTAGKQDKKQPQDDMEAKEKALREETRKKNCEIAQNNLANLQRGGNIRYLDADGKVIRLSEEERQKHIEDANKHIKENCNP
jgi:hypothetical protein